MAIIRREQTELEQLTIDQKDPSGFLNLTDSTLTISDSGPDRTVSLGPIGSFSFYVKGEKFTKTLTETVQFTDVEGLHYIYYDDTGTLQSQANPSTTQVEAIIKENALVTVVYWDLVNSKHIYFGEERHGLQMDGSTHAYLHINFGTRFLTGSALNTFSVDGTGNVAADAQFGIDSGYIQDEDLVLQNALLAATTGAPIYYKLGAAGDWRQIVNAGFSVTTTGTGRLAWNEFTGGAWQQAEVGNNDYVLCHIFSTNDKDTAYISVMGQDTYNTINDARDGATEEINLLVTTGLPFAEFVPIATVIFQTSDAYTNAVKARVRSTDTGDDYIDWRESGISPALGSVTSHANLTDRAYDVAGHGTGYTGFMRGTTVDTVDPGPTDDASKGYVLGDHWINETSQVLFALTDATINAAVWKKIEEGVHWQAAVKDQIDFTTAEPASPTNGDRYINTVTGVSSVTTQSVTATYIYQWNGTSWTPTVPLEGYVVYDIAANAAFIFDGSAWVLYTNDLPLDNIYYVNDAGADSNLGTSVSQAFATLAKAITEVNLQSPSLNNKYEIRILGGMNITADFVHPSYTTINAPSATFNCNITGNDYSTLICNAGVMGASGGGYCITKTSGVQTYTVNVLGLALPVEDVFNCNSGTVIFLCDELNINGGQLLNPAASGSVRIVCAGRIRHNTNDSFLYSTAVPHINIIANEIFDGGVSGKSIVLANPATVKIIANEYECASRPLYELSNGGRVIANVLKWDDSFGGNSIASAATLYLSSLLDGSGNAIIKNTNGDIVLEGSGDVLLDAGGQIVLDAYSKLGSIIDNIPFKLGYIAGTMPATGLQNSYALPDSLTRLRVISWQVIVDGADSSSYKRNEAFVANSSFSTRLAGSLLWITNTAGSDSNVASRPFQATFLYRS